MLCTVVFVNNTAVYNFTILNIFVLKIILPKTDKSSGLTQLLKSSQIIYQFDFTSEVLYMALNKISF